ncbi:MAG: GWxTD domain-containing protein [Gemmatimonadota bacterium]
MRLLKYALVLPVLVALPLVGGVTGAPSAPWDAFQESEDVRVRHARFWRPNSQSTLVEVIVGLRVGAGAVDVASAPRVELVVTDAAGQEIHRTSWVDTISATVREVARSQGSVELAEQLRVALLPGTYDFHVMMDTPVGRDSTATRVEAFEVGPLLSDVLVSGGIRILDEGERPTGAELVKGDYAIEAGSRVVLLPTRSELWYYLELYSPEGTEPVETQLDFRVEPASGSGASVELQRRILLASPGAVDAAKLDLTGMPPGEYRLVVTATAGERMDRRTVAFTIGAFGTGPVVAQAGPPRGALTEPQLYDRYFLPGVLDSTQVSQLVQALAVAPPGPSIDRSMLGLDTEAQGRFLARYFSRLDLGPATPEHELYEEFRDRVAFVEREYAEKDIGRPGIHTDRGRIYLRYGPPDERLLLPVTQNRGVEAWRYTRNRSRKYVFLDETGFQHYNLIYAEDPNEQTVPNWEERVGDRDVVNEIRSF